MQYGEKANRRILWDLPRAISGWVRNHFHLVLETFFCQSREWLKASLSLHFSCLASGAPDVSSTTEAAHAMNVAEKAVDDLNLKHPWWNLFNINCFLDCFEKILLEFALLLVFLSDFATWCYWTKCSFRLRNLLIILWHLMSTIYSGYQLTQWRRRRFPACFFRLPDPLRKSTISWFSLTAMVAILARCITL